MHAMQKGENLGEYRVTVPSTVQKGTDKAGKPIMATEDVTRLARDPKSAQDARKAYLMMGMAREKLESEADARAWILTRKPDYGRRRKGHENFEAAKKHRLEFSR